MANGMNKVFLLGNLGADPELKHSTGGAPYLRLRVATNDGYLDKEQVWQERTEWHTVTLWGKRAEPLSRLLSQGSRVMVEGYIRTTSYEKEGSTHYFTEVKAREIYLAGWGRDAPRGQRRDHQPPPLDGPQAADGRGEAAAAAPQAAAAATEGTGGS